MITIGDRFLTLDDFYEVIYKNAKVELSKKSIEKVEHSFLFLTNFSKEKVIYGINTGFGPMAEYKIHEQEQVQLQYNLIRSHCAGSGNLISQSSIRALILARINSLALGYSGVHIDLIYTLVKLLNLNILPVIYEHGSVGASGDLVQLAHLALCLIGEGEVHYEGKIVETCAVFKEHQITPIKIYMREGIALMNGTSAMTGIGILNVIAAHNLVNWSIASSCMINEIVESYDDHFSLELNKVKHHPGQQKVSAAMRNILDSTNLIRKRSEHLYSNKKEEGSLGEKVQEYYSIRCVPQVLGPIYDTIKYAEETLINELNSVNDNPVIDSDANDVYHGGNFHGDYVALEMDKLKIAITKLSMLCERQLNYLMNNKLNNILPPFINLGKLGLNFGMQGVQFTATSTVAENQTLSYPMYVHSIPNNNDNQDIVSMGTNAALLSRKVIDNSFEVIAIHFISIIQAIEYLGFQARISNESSKIFTQLRKIVPKFENDLPKYKDLKAVRQFLFDTKLDFIK
ncbi:MAG TPA: aromatic amino acid ammonia-lyase [Cytophagaceae bacterium]